jgi:hypothetical protein
MEIGAETVSQDEIEARDPMVGSSEEDADAVYDGGRNWTADATEVLVRAWRKVSWEGRAPDEKMTHVIQRIFVEYQRRVPSTRRNAKAVEDKVNCLSQAYRFITDFNAHRVPGSTGRPSWDRIPLRERKEIRYGQLRDALSSVGLICVRVGERTGSESRTLTARSLRS